MIKLTPESEQILRELAKVNDTIKILFEEIDALRENNRILADSTLQELRKHYAGLAMHAILNKENVTWCPENQSKIAKVAIGFADALIEELSRRNEKKENYKMTDTIKVTVIDASGPKICEIILPSIQGKIVFDSRMSPIQITLGSVVVERVENKNEKDDEAANAKTNS